MFIVNYLTHRRVCQSKRAERDSIISTLTTAEGGYDPATLTLHEKSILSTPIGHTSNQVRNGIWSPRDVLHAYGKRALWAHKHTNCLTEILLTHAESQCDSQTQGPLAGIPVSVKDTVNIAGYDSTIGHSRLARDPAPRDSPLVSLLRDAGALIYVKTNLPITMLSFECDNDLFGRTENPHVAGYTSGGSSGGEGALIALGGSRVGVGSDVAGSVRVPAAWSGIYTVRFSTGRFPKAGNRVNIAGQEGVLTVYSPMAKSLVDLRYFIESIIEMKPWTYDTTVHPIPWRDVAPELTGRPIKWGVLRDDGVVPPTPAIERALDTVISALRKKGDEVFELVSAPSCYTALQIASQLVCADGGETYTSKFTSFWERNDAGVSLLSRLLSLPRWVKKLYALYLTYIRRDPITAGLIQDFHRKTVVEAWDLVRQREELRLKWFEYWKSQDIDFILTPTNALPAVPHGGMTYSVASCGYTFMWNLLDYSAGVVPVGKVDPALDNSEKGNGGRLESAIARRAWSLYDPVKMKGLPTAVQIVGKRLQEEKVLWGMERAVAALGECDVVYEEIKVD